MTKHRRKEEGDGEASWRNEPAARVMGRIARELIENDGAESYSSEPTERLGNEELEKSYRLEKRPRKEDTDIDQKLERLKE